MRFNCLYSLLLAAGMTILLPAGRGFAAELESANAEPAAPSIWGPQGAPVCDGSDPIREFAARVGYWGSSVRGSRTIIGEYQDLDASPFWDADGLSSNGDRTVDFSATGTDEETSVGRLHYYGGPSVTANVDFERFRHELEPKNYAGFASIAGATKHTPPQATDNFFSRDDLNPGQDYAIRVQEFKANFKGDLTRDLKWSMKVFGIQKEGDRQANAVTHCYDASRTFSPLTSTTNTTANRQCHVVSQAQHIDWRTTELEPGLELNLGALTLNYSHTVRMFEQNDQQVFNVYRYAANENASNALGFPIPNYYNGSTPAGSLAGYNSVPESMTNIDRLKVHAEINEDTNFYGLGYVGDTENRLRDINRHFGGGDFRVTNDTIDKVTVTGRAKVYTENTQMPSTDLNTLYPDQANFYQEVMFDPAANPWSITQPVSRDTQAVGVDARWRPFQDDCNRVRRGLSFTSGYEYSTLRRKYATSELDFFDVEFVQPNSNANTVFVGVEEKWSPCLLTSARYKYIATEYPLFGISPEATGTSYDDAINTMLPRLENRLELSETWTPTDNFMFTGTFFVENAVNHGPYAYFDSTNYPFVLSTWYAPTQKWSFSGGYANFMNRINQDITLTSAVSGTLPTATTAPWQYMSKADVFNIGTAYCFTQRVKLTGDFEYVRGLNTITNVGTVSSGATSFQDLADYSRVSNETYRVSAGVDYTLRPRVTTYFRYNLYDFGDLATGVTSGTSHLYLAGLTATY